MRRHYRAMGWALLPLVLVLDGGCTTLKPDQAAALKEAQRIADEVTSAYGLGRVRVFAYDRLPPYSAAAYSERDGWILIAPNVLASSGLPVVLTHELGHVTLGHRSVSASTSLELFTLRRDELEANRRGVEIMVRFLAYTEREAANRYAIYMIAGSLVRAGKAINLPSSHFHPCIQLRDLWRNLAYSEPPPACEQK